MSPCVLCACAQGLGYGAVLLSSPAIYLGAASLGVTAGVRFGVAYAVIFALATAAAAAAHCYARYRAAKGAAVSKVRRSPTRTSV